MKPGRYVGAVGAPSAIAALRKEQCLAEKFSTVIDTPGLWIVASPALGVIQMADAAVLLGALYTPGRPGPLRALSSDAQKAVLQTRGDHLIAAYWGDYIAVLGSEDGADILRGPFGRLPCFHAPMGSVTVFASDVDLLVAGAGIGRNVSWPALARQLAAGDIRRNETCLEGVCELRGGDRLSLSAAATSATPPAKQSLWSPFACAHPARQFQDRDEADRRLGEYVDYVVRTRLSDVDHSLLLLSGGLDSSIVAASMTRAGLSFDSLTLVTDSSTGDERRYARSVAAAVDTSLAERHRAIERIDISRSAAASLARPIARVFEQDSQGIMASEAVAFNADIVLDGGGGDNLFCSLQSVSPVADCLLSREPAAAFWSLARNMGALADTATLTVAWKAWRRSRRRDRGFRWTKDMSFLSPMAREWAEGATDHPWLAAPRDMLPGKAAHIALLIGAQGLAEDCDATKALREMSVLVAQPLVETCLRIPTWFWFEAGYNRAAARRAFAPDLPDDIVWRRSKGTPDSFVVEIYDHYRPVIREMLATGLLAQHGIIDTDAVTAVIDDPRPTAGQAFVRIMQLLDAETWARAQAETSPPAR